MKQLQKADYEILRRYWEDYRTISQEIKRDEYDSPLQLEHMKEIVSAIEHVFNDTPKEFKTIITKTFWHKRDAKSVAPELFIPISKINRIQKSILNQTADYLKWI